MLPLMVFHQIQLVLCAVIASVLSREHVEQPTDDDAGRAMA
jgi:predicted Na+-dependent transporter